MELTNLQGVLEPKSPPLHAQEWAIHDCKSMNGVTVNGEAVGVSGRTDHVFVFCR